MAMYPKRTRWSVFKAHIKRTAWIIKYGKGWSVLFDWKYWRQFYRLNKSAVLD